MKFTKNMTEGNIYKSFLIERFVTNHDFSDIASSPLHYSFQFVAIGAESAT